MQSPRLTRIISHLAGAGVLLALLLVPARPGILLAGDADLPAEENPARARHIGYGISIAPHLPSRPDLLDEMGMDWVMIYSTSQLNDYPNQRVIYRVNFPPRPEEMDDWERGLYYLARELDSRGVDAVQIGNEPNLAFEWEGRTPDARQFAAGLCRAYHVFKETAPDIVVVAAGLASTITTPDRKAITDLDFAQEMLNYGAGDCFDAWGYHPYGYNQPPEVDPGQYELVFRRTERMYQLLWNNGIRDRQIWITEFGWVRDPAEAGFDCANEDAFRDFNWIKFSQNVQADYTARAFRFAEANWPWVGPMILWNLNWNQYTYQELDKCSHMRWYAILDEDEQPLPAVSAIKAIDKTKPVYYQPVVGAVVNGLTRTAEAGCAGAMELGTFTVRNAGYPGTLEVKVEPANGPGRPLVWTSVDTAENGDEVRVFVDATGVEPGLHLIAINLRTYTTYRVSAHVVRGWLLIHYPTSPECVVRYDEE